MQLFSARKKIVPDTCGYKVDDRVRSRLMYTLKNCVETYERCPLVHVLEDVARQMFLKLGALRMRPGRRVESPSDAAFEHFFACTDEEVMDFLQFWFLTSYYGGGQRTVDAINEVLQEENIGFELTAFQREEQGEGSYQIIPPLVIEKSEKRLHKEVIQPCLHALADKRFASASGELMNAFEEFRKRKYADAITDAGAAVESVLKSICKAKRWAYDPAKDTCSKLLDICREKKLFHPFYKPILEATATIRNKLGDAHGKGPNPEFLATKEDAEHMFYTACTNINYLVALADL